ncbi:MAG: hypothetical protein ACM3JI_02345 [Anaerolineae bacterium]
MTRRPPSVWEVAVTPDPQGFRDEPNLYAFVQGNSLKHIDLYGLEAESSFWQDNANRGKST